MKALRRYYVRNGHLLDEQADSMYVARTVVVLASEADDAIALLTDQLHREQANNTALYDAVERVTAERDTARNELQAAQCAEKMSADIVAGMRKELFQARNALIIARPHVEISFARNPQHRATAAALDAIDACFADAALTPLAGE